jgi:tetratricopeptide (TPR) repeat protein
MMAAPLLSALLAATAIGAGPVTAQPTPAPQTGDATVLRLPPLAERLSRFSPDRFAADYAALSSRLLIRPGSEETPAALRASQAPDLLLSFAALYLAHGFWTEARSTLSDLDPETLAAELRAEHARLSLLAGALDPTGAPRDLTGLLPRPGESWADAALYRALIGAAPDPEELGSAASLVGSLPVPVRQRVLPALLEKALDARAWDLARLFGAEMQATPGMSGGTADLFLQGLGAERVGMREDALLAYERASGGGDLWAQRARLAWAELALSSGLRETGQVRAVLSQGRLSWRGGPLELSALRILFELTRDAGDPLAALDLLTEVRDRHPDRAGEVASEEDRWALVERFYRMGETGEIAFGALFDGHRRLFSDLSADPRFMDLAEAFAERLYRSGAYRLAAEEYRRAHEAMGAQAAAGMAPPPARRDLTRLRLAEILLDAGLPEEADPLLVEATLDPDLADRIEPLRARLHAARGDHAAVLATWVPEPDPEHLTLLARAHLRSGDWGAARDRLVELTERPAGTDAGMGSELALASFRAGRLEEDAERLRRTPVPPLVITSLLNAESPPTRMGRGEVEGRLAEVDRVLETAARLIEGGRGAPTDRGR